MFTQVTVSGIVVLSNDTPASSGIVYFTLNTPISDGDTLVVPQKLAAACNGSGDFTITLNANDDTTTTPIGSYYLVQVVPTGSGAPADQFYVVLAHANPTVELFSLTQYPVTNPAPISIIV